MKLITKRKTNKSLREAIKDIRRDINNGYRWAGTMGEEYLDNSEGEDVMTYSLQLVRKAKPSSSS